LNPWKLGFFCWGALIKSLKQKKGGKVEKMGLDKKADWSGKGGVP
jgi:hypothetical protein